MTTIPSILHENACRWPDRPALLKTHRGSDSALTFRELEAAATHFAIELHAKGIRHGDPILIFVPISFELYVVLLAIFRLGAVAVFVDPSSGLRHINTCCEKLPPVALISVWPLRWLRPFVSGLRRIPKVFAPPKLSSTSALSAAILPGLPAPEDSALITFTSGSTGAPKAAVRIHRFLIAQHEALKKSINLQPGEIDVATLPVFVLANLASGVTTVLPDAKISHPGSVNAPRLARQIERLRPTRSAGSPAFYQRLMDEPSSLAKLRKIYTGGAPVFPAFLQRLQALAPKAEIVAVYGSTEAEPVAHIACDEISASDWLAMREGNGLLAGVPISEIRLRIIPDQWGKPALLHDALPREEIGEIVVAGDHVLKGYLKGEGNEETKVLIEGEIWHRTGDAGTLDAAGRLWLLGRCAARIQDEKRALYPFSVECIAMSFPFIRRAAFILFQGKRLLVLEACPGISDASFSDLKRSLARAAIDEIRIIPSIPVDARHNAKVNYPQLIAALQKNDVIIPKK